ncbi:MAG: elongation factor P [Bacillota bacterium]|jgi:elongation factor P
MISTNDFRTGVTIELDGEVYSVIEFQHVKPGKGSAFVRTKIRNMRTGNVLEKTFPAGEKITRARLERREMQYLYSSGEDYVLMDVENYEQMNLQKGLLGDGAWFLKENMNIWVLMYRGSPLGVDLPNSVDLEVIQTDPGVKGDTASGGTKPAKLETGAVVKVPLFVQVGDIIRVDTRSGEYIERATQN